MMRLLAAACLIASLAGCQNAMWWEYRDDPYIASAVNGGEALRGVNALSAEERQMALRIVAHQAAEARRQGRPEEAERLDAVIIRRYAIEKDPAVRACIVRICAPAAGRGSVAMVRFLRDRIAAGEFPGSAALALAVLAPRSAFGDIEPLTRHPAPEVRYQAAVALTVLRDPRGFEPVRRVWSGMERTTWPERVDGMTIDQIRASLGTRAQRAFGRPLS